MLDSLIPLLSSYRLSSHVQRWVVLQVQALAVHHPTLLQACQAALTAIDAAVSLRRDYERTRRRHQGSDLAHQLDLQIDRQICAAHARLVSLRRQGGPLGKAAALLLDAAFPGGLKRHVSAPHTEQVTHNALLLELLADPTHAAVVDYLRLDDIRARLDELVPRFEQALAAQRRVTGAMVHEAERAGENAVLKLMCGIVFCFDAADPEQRRTRDLLLAPFLGARELLQQEHKRQGPKVDPQPVSVVETPVAQEPAACEGAQAVASEPAATPEVLPERAQVVAPEQAATPEVLPERAQVVAPAQAATVPPEPALAVAPEPAQEADPAPEAPRPAPAAHPAAPTPWWMAARPASSPGPTRHGPAEGGRVGAVVA